MIVKNEAQSIVSTVLSVKKIVDRYTILDTGSTDDTVRLIQKAFDGVDGDVYHEPFLDFSTTRNRAIELEGHQSTFALMLSGDETLQNGIALRDFLERQRYSITEAFNVRVLLGNESEYDSTRVHRTSRDWFYKGVTHEYMTTSRGNIARLRIPDVRIYHDQPNSLAKRDRWLKDEQLLLNDWSFVPTARTAFYLGQTYSQMQNWSASFYWYETRWRMKGWNEEEYESRYRMARIAEHLALAWDRIEPIYVSAASYRPARAEPLYELAYHYYEQGDYATSYDYLMRASRIPVPERLRLYIRRDVYEYRVPDLLGAVAYFMNEPSVGRKAIERALRYKPNDERLLKNLAYYDEL